jgi:hypothetical protein
MKKKFFFINIICVKVVIPTLHKRDGNRKENGVKLSNPTPVILMFLVENVQSTTSHNVKQSMKFRLLDFAISSID